MNWKAGIKRYLEIARKLYGHGPWWYSVILVNTNFFILCEVWLISDVVLSSVGKLDFIYGVKIPQSNLFLLNHILIPLISIIIVYQWLTILIGFIYGAVVNRHESTN